MKLPIPDISEQPLAGHSTGWDWLLANTIQFRRCANLVGKLSILSFGDLLGARNHILYICAFSLAIYMNKKCVRIFDISLWLDLDTFVKHKISR